MQGLLVLEDGSIFEGEAVGSTGKKLGEVVFNTAMTGYQQILTDPSYCEQIVVMTYPMIGNYGVNRQDMEANRSYASGIVAHTFTDPHNWQATGRIENFLKEQNIIGLHGIDTRALTIHLRRHGNLKGIVAVGDYAPADLLAELRAAKDQTSKLVAKVSTPKPYQLPGGPCKIVVLDFGVKNNILRWFRNNNCTLVVAPYNTSAEEIMAYNPWGLVLSNGPGDPQAVQEVIKTIQDLVGRVPILGVCLGHQLLGLAFGGKTYKLPFGHHGANHPVKDLLLDRVFMTSQNHGYALDKASIPGSEFEVSHLSLFDGTVEGLRHKKLPVMAVQFHPEGAPGPQDSEYIFKQFLANVQDTRALSLEVS